MIEVTNSTFSSANEKLLNNIMSGEYLIDNERLNRDIKRIDEMLAVPDLTQSEKTELAKGKWVLQKWQLREITNLSLSYRNYTLDFKDLETECDYLRLDREGLTPREDFGCLSSCMNVRYLFNTGYRMIFVDYTDLMDVLASEYTICDSNLDAHTIDLWTKGTTAFKINDGTCLIEMVRGELFPDIPIPGGAFEMTSQFAISNMCFKVNVAGDKIASYFGTMIDVDLGGGTLGSSKIHKRSRYAKVLRVCAHEVLGAALGGVASYMAYRDKFKLVGFTDRAQLAFLVQDDADISKFTTDLALVVKTYGKRYKFAPKLWEYDYANDKIYEIGTGKTGGQ